MSETIPGYTVYRLSGDLAAAAAALVTAEKTVYEKRRADGIRPRHSSGFALERREIMTALRKSHAAVIATLRLDAGSVKIEQDHGGAPRAYYQFPHIAEAVDQDGQPHYYLFCPTDYKGGHPTPSEGEAVPEGILTITDFGEIVHKQHGYLSPPLLTQNDAGTALPAGFDPKAHSFRENGIEGHGYKVFIAGGSSLECVKDFLNRSAALEKAKKDIGAALQDIVPSLGAGKILGGGTAPVVIRCRFDETPGTKPQVWLQARRGETAVMIKDNDHFTVEDFKDGAFLIKPNTATAAGKALQKLFDHLTPAPDLGQYFQLHNPTAPSGLKGRFHSHSAEGAKVPKLDTVRGVHYLVYLVADNAPKDHCSPPGGIPVSTAEYLWLKADIRDEERFISLPEPPPALSHMRPVKFDFKP